jgi:transposase
MSLKVLPVPPIPDETARVAQAAFPNGTLCLQLRDTLGTLYTDTDFADLFPHRGQPAEAPWRLALVTVLQVVEGLSDRQAADAVRSWLDWKYALSLELSDPGFDHTLASARSQSQAGSRRGDRLSHQSSIKRWQTANIRH